MAHAADCTHDFTYRSARSGAVTGGLALAVVVEALVLHLWLAARHPTWAWALTALAGATLGYLAFEYRAWGAGRVRVTPAALNIRVAGRAAVDVPRAAATAAPATWRDLPRGAAADYVNVTAPAQPNVLLVLTAPVPVRLAGGLVTRRVGRLGLHLDDPAGFVRAVGAPPAS